MANKDSQYRYMKSWIKKYKVYLNTNIYRHQKLSQKVMSLTYCPMNSLWVSTLQYPIALKSLCTKLIRIHHFICWHPRQFNKAVSKLKMLIYFLSLFTVVHKNGLQCLVFWRINPEYRVGVNGFNATKSLFMRAWLEEQCALKLTK